MKGRTLAMDWVVRGIFLTFLFAGAFFYIPQAAAQVQQPTCGPVGGGSDGDFGCRTAPTAGASTSHKGTDYRCPNNTPLNAGISGTMSCKSRSDGNGAGNRCYIQGTGSNSCIQLAYFHMSDTGFPSGGSVTAGQNMGNSGNTGVGTGAHLHFEVRVNGSPIDSTTFFQRYNSGNLCGDAGAVKALLDDAQAKMNDCGGNKPSPTDPGGQDAKECDVGYQSAIQEQVNGYQQYLSQTTRALVPPPPSVAQLSCFDYYAKLMGTTVLGRFTGTGSTNIMSGFSGGILGDVLSTPFNSFMQGSVLSMLDPNKMLSSISSSITSTLSNAFNVSSALGLGSGANPALCNAMSAMWNLLQCSGALNNLPSFNLDLGQLGQSLMPSGCASKVLFDAATKAAGLNMNEPISYHSAQQYFTRMETGYK